QAANDVDSRSAGAAHKVAIASKHTWDWCGGIGDLARSTTRAWDTGSKEDRRPSRGCPVNRDSGKLKGKRAIWGGRSDVRAVLYMSDLVAIRRNASMRSFYQRLRPPAKPPRWRQPPVCES